MRKPEDKKGAYETREALWNAIRKLKTFSITQLHGELKLDKSTIRQYVTTLAHGGFVEISASAGQTGIHIFTLVRDALEPPRLRRDGSEVTQGRGRQNMWMAMRILKRFDLATIWAASGTEEYPVARGEIKTYLLYLAKSGYLKKTGQGEKAVYVLVRYTGPKAPMIQRIKQVWDPNLKEVTWPKDVDSRLRGNDNGKTQHE